MSDLWRNENECIEYGIMTCLTYLSGKKGSRLLPLPLRVKEMVKPCNDSNTGWIVFGAATGGSSETGKTRTRSFLAILLLLWSQYRNKRVSFFSWDTPTKPKSTLYAAVFWYTARAWRSCWGCSGWDVMKWLNSTWFKTSFRKRKIGTFRHLCNPYRVQESM